MSSYVEDISTRGFDWQVTKRIAGYMLPDWRDMLVAVLAMLLTVGANVSTAPLICLRD
jgi:hypothetical protein